MNNHTVETQMLIRRPAAEVFNAFADPEITTKFWFTKSSGKLEEGQKVTWSWEMYGVSAEVVCKTLKPGELIVIEWGDPGTTVAFKFTPTSEENTYVEITQHGFQAEGDDLIAILKDSTAGFTSVLAGLKAFLEHGIQLNLVADKYPDKTIK